MLVLPSGAPSLFAGRAFVLDGAALTGIGPVTTQGQPVFLVRIAVDQLVTGRTDVHVFCGQVAKLLLAKPAFDLDTRRDRFGQRDADAGLLTGEDFFAAEVATVSHRFQDVRLQSSSR